MSAVGTQSHAIEIDTTIVSRSHGRTYSKRKN